MMMTIRPHAPAGFLALALLTLQTILVAQAQQPTTQPSKLASEATMHTVQGSDI
jgi:hypothetical protein